MTGRPMTGPAFTEPSAQTGRQDLLEQLTKAPGGTWAGRGRRFEGVEQCGPLFDADLAGSDHPQDGLCLFPFPCITHN